MSDHPEIIEPIKKMLEERCTEVRQAKSGDEEPSIPFDSAQSPNESASDYSESDKHAMKESLNTIRTALVQPFGANADAKRRDSKCVTDVEFDRAVMVVLSTALAMWLSGALDTVQCVGGAE